MNPLRHVLFPGSALRRYFPTSAMTTIERAIERSERSHRGEIRVAIEAALDFRTLRRTRTVRERAKEAFAERNCSATAERNGVLIYVLLAERAAVIVPDRGLEGRIDSEEWRRVEALIEEAFPEGRWLEGVLDGIARVTRLLEREFPQRGNDTAELPDRPSLL